MNENLKELQKNSLAQFPWGKSTGEIDEKKRREKKMRKAKRFITLCVVHGKKNETKIIKHCNTNVMK